jgi:hypothetical protein
MSTYGIPACGSELAFAVRVTDVRVGRQRKQVDLLSTVRAARPITACRTRIPTAFTDV